MTLDTTYLQNFIDALASGDPRRLGVRNKKKAVEAWKHLFADYSNRMGGSKTTALLVSARAASVLRLRLALIRACVDSLSKGYHKETSEMLKTLGVRTSVKRLTLGQDLIKVMAEIKSLTLQLRSLQKDTEGLVESSEKIDVRSEFSRTLVELSKYLGYHFDPKKHTVSEFIYAIKKLEQDAKQ